MTCLYESEWGPCSQQRWRDGLCGYHWQAVNVPGFRTDRSYHEKICRGLLEPTVHYLTDVEVDALFRGRARHDGRRLDHYTKY